MKNKGFTLIELLLVITVILIISTSSYVGFQQFSKNQALGIAADTLHNGLNEARSYAVSQVITQCHPTQTLAGYQVSFYRPASPALDYYSLDEVCRDSAGVLQPGIEIKRQTLPTSVRFAANYSPILFLILTGGVNGGAETIRIKSGSQFKDTTVTAVGVIQ